MKNVCAFYASDYHFEMISLPYINQKIENKNEIIVLTQNNLEDTLKTLLERVNLKEEKKKKILNINWKDNDLLKFRELKNKIEEKRNIIIFIKGKQNYINNVNKNLEKWTKNNKIIKIIDCYEIEEVSENMDKIMKQYEKILRINGEKEINKL